MTYPDLLIALDALGDVLTMPVAVLLSVVLVCAVFVVWRLASWCFALYSQASRVPEPIPMRYYGSQYLRPLWRGVRWAWGQTHALGRRSAERSMTKSSKR